MTRSIRLNEIERKLIKKKSREINKKLVMSGREPMKESEILHEILEKTIERAELNGQGNIEISLNLGQESTTK
jgi:transposase